MKSTGYARQEHKQTGTKGQDKKKKRPEVPLLFTNIYPWVPHHRVGHVMRRTPPMALSLSPLPRTSRDPAPSTRVQHYARLGLSQCKFF
jgi:hypothetical protein